jgi:DNA-binding NarL/FixJ family response regulator
MKGIIKAIVDEYAAGIIKAVMAEFAVGEKDFRSSNLPYHVRARVIAIKRLNAVGFSNNEISRIMGIDPTTVSYRLNAKERARRRAANAKRIRCRLATLAVAAGASA